MLPNNHSHRDQLAAAWISEHKDYREQKEAKVGPGYRELNRLVESDPDEALNVVERICELDASDPVMEVLAAGPLENLLALHGLLIIGRIEELAKTNSVFRDLLGGVWKNAMDNEIWDRVQSARGGTW